MSINNCTRVMLLTFFLIAGLPRAQAQEQSQTQGHPQDPLIEKLKNAVYRCDGKNIQLKNGYGERKLAGGVRDEISLDVDSIVLATPGTPTDLVALVTLNHQRSDAGNTPPEDELHAFRLTNGLLQDVASGYMAMIKAKVITGGEIRLTTLSYGPDDSRYSPSVETTRSFSVSGGKFIPVLTPEEVAAKAEEKAAKAKETAFRSRHKPLAGLPPVERVILEQTAKWASAMTPSTDGRYRIAEGTEGGDIFKSIAENMPKEVYKSNFESGVQLHKWLMGIGTRGTQDALAKLSTLVGKYYVLKGDAYQIVTDGGYPREGRFDFKMFGGEILVSGMKSYVTFECHSTTKVPPYRIAPAIVRFTGFGLGQNRAGQQIIVPRVRILWMYMGIPYSKNDGTSELHLNL